eukprot:5020101-Alexandrium_andersonii.AAC.1
MGALARRPWGVGRAGLGMYFARVAPYPGVIVKWVRSAGSVHISWVDGSGVGHVAGDGGLWANGWGAGWEVEAGLEGWHGV